MILRYPGGKSRLLSNITPHIIHQIENNENILTYCEPFIGSGSITYNVLKKKNYIKKIILNDKDYSLSCLWNSILFNFEELEDRILAYQPTVVDFFHFKEVLTRNNDSLKEESKVSLSLKKLAIHQMSYSGLGVKAGGPIGGKSQKSNYDISCRWNPKNIIKKFKRLRSTLLKYQISDNIVYCLDYKEIINKSNEFTIIYLDPPYYLKGKDMYACSFKDEEHKILSEVLKNTDSKWILSYDDCEEVRNLYKWANMSNFDAKYFIKTIRNKKEILIFSPNYYD
jgi:DNA adenine methylase